MSVQVEKLEKNMAKLTVEVAAENFTAALEQAYKKDRSKIAVPGFRKGKAPRKMIQKLYGAQVFYEEAANILLQTEYFKAARECGEQIVSRPQISVEQIEEGKPFIFTAQVALKPQVTLGAYKGVEVEKTVVEVSEEEVDREIDKERENNSRTQDVDDRPVQKGDMIKLDFEGSVDGVPFEGGKAENYALTVGSGSFIPGFEDQLVGANIGEEVEVHVTFPEEYHAAELKGKAAVFKCKVNEIKVKELPEADDEFAKDVSEFDTIAEYRDDVRAKLLEKKEAEAKRQKQDKALAKAVENAQMEIPEPMVEEEAEQMLENFEQRLKSQGLTLEQYMQFTGMTVEKLSEQMRPDALKRIQNTLVLEEIVKAENIETTEEQIDEEIAKMAKAYRMEEAKLRELVGEGEKEQIRRDLTMQAAVELLGEQAVEVEAAAETEAEA